MISLSGAGYGLSPVSCQAFTATNEDISPNGPLPYDIWSNLIDKKQIHNSLEEIHSEILSMKHPPCCSGDDALIDTDTEITNGYCICRIYFMILFDFVSSDGAIRVCIKNHQIINEDVGFYGKLESIKLVSLIDRINSLVFGKANWNFRLLTLVIDGTDIPYEIALKWMSPDLTDEISTLEIIVWCRQAASHYLNQCWPRTMSP